MERPVCGHYKSSIMVAQDRFSWTERSVVDNTTKTKLQENLMGIIDQKQRRHTSRLLHNKTWLLPVSNCISTQHITQAPKKKHDVIYFYYCEKLKWPINKRLLMWQRLLSAPLKALQLQVICISCQGCIKNVFLVLHLVFVYRSYRCMQPSPTTTTTSVIGWFDLI